MRANTVHSISEAILKRLERGAITIQYKENPDHTTREEFPRALHMKGASPDDVFGALKALIDGGYVERTLSEEPRLKWGSGPDPKEKIVRKVTYTRA